MIICLLSKFSYSSCHIKWKYLLTEELIYLLITSAYYFIDLSWAFSNLYCCKSSFSYVRLIISHEEPVVVFIECWAQPLFDSIFQSWCTFIISLFFKMSNITVLKRHFYLILDFFSFYLFMRHINIWDKISLQFLNINCNWCKFSNICLLIWWILI